MRLIFKYKSKIMTRFFGSCVLVILSTFLYATSFGQITYGAKAGINFNSFRGDNRYDVVPGFNAGGFIKYPVLDFLKLRGELLYNQQGANLIDYPVLEPDLFHSDATVRFHTIQIPVLAELGIPSLNEESIQPKLLIGAFYSYLISARERFSNVAKVGGYAPVEYRGYSTVDSYFERSQFGILGGIAGEIELFNRPVSLEFRYQYNINRINKSGVQKAYNLSKTFDEWGSNLYLGTLSFNVSVTLY
jgi:hypothetical protein